MNYRTQYKTLHRVDAVLFDMDGVVVDSMHAHAECWIEVFKEHGVILDKTDIFKREGMTGLESIADIFAEKGFVIPPREVLQNLQQKKLALFSTYHINVYPQMFTLLPLLHSKGKQIGIVTGSFKYLVTTLIPDSLLSILDVIVSVDDVQNGKPHPDPYLEAIKKLNTDATSVIVVENAPMGIKSARAAGLFCVAVCSTLDASFLQDADVICHNHDELVAYIASCV